MSANHRHPWVEGRRPPGTAWTEAEVGVLRDLHTSHTARQIATLLGRGRTRQAVLRKLRHLRLTGRPYHEEPSATLREEIALARAEWATAPQYRPTRDV